MRKSLATPQQGGRKSILGYGSAKKQQKIPEQKKLTFSANKSRLHTSGIGIGGKRWSNQGTQSIKDTRPLSNRAFQKQITEDILEFLTESGYPHPISAKVLSAPTTKEFLRVFEHLYSCINSNFKMEKKFEEEVPRILKTLNYPFTISKSAMFAIGSLHTWPTLLGALHWMVELIRTVNTIDIEQVLFPLTFQEEELQDKRHEKTFNDYFSQIYHKYMMGEDDFTESREKLQCAIISDAGCTEEDLGDLKSRVANMEEELAALEAEPDPLEEAIKEKLLLEEKIEQDTMAMRNIDQQTTVLKQQYLNFKRQLDEEGIDCRQLGDHSRQKEIKHKSTEVRTQLERFNSERERMEKQNNERELRYSKLYENISTSLNEYNNFAKELMLNPHIKNYLGDNSIVLTFDHNLDDLSRLHETKQKLKALLNQLSNQVAEDCYKLELEIINEQDKAQKITEAIGDKRHQLMQTAAQLNRIDKELEDKEAEVEEFTGSFENLIIQEKKMEDELKSIAQIVNDEKLTLEAKKEMLEEDVSKMRKEENEFIEVISQYCEDVIKYRQQVKEGVTAFNKCLKDEIDHIKELERSLEE